MVPVSCPHTTVPGIAELELIELLEDELDSELEDELELDEVLDELELDEAAKSTHQPISFKSYAVFSINWSTWLLELYPWTKKPW